jgi:hypothetical protein
VMAQLSMSRFRRGLAVHSSVRDVVLSWCWLHSQFGCPPVDVVAVALQQALFSERFEDFPSVRLGVLTRVTGLAEGAAAETMENGAGVWWRQLPGLFDGGEDGFLSGGEFGGHRK